MILGICGSPRKKATEYVLKEALKMLEEKDFKTQFFSVRQKNISFCQHCDYCLKNKECRIKDDMYKLYNLLREAKGIVIATPVYNGGVSAQIKAVMDRCRALISRDPNFFKNKVGMGHCRWWRQNRWTGIGNTADNYIPHTQRNYSDKWWIFWRKFGSYILVKKHA